MKRRLNIAHRPAPPAAPAGPRRADGRASTRRAATPSWTSVEALGRAGHGASSTRPTTWRRPSACATASASSTTGEILRRGHAPRARGARSASSDQVTPVASPATSPRPPSARPGGRRASRGATPVTSGLELLVDGRARLAAAAPRRPSQDAGARPRRRGRRAGPRGRLPAPDRPGPARLTQDRCRCAPRCHRRQGPPPAAPRPLGDHAGDHRPVRAGRGLQRLMPSGGSAFTARYAVIDLDGGPVASAFADGPWRRCRCRVGRCRRPRRSRGPRAGRAGARRGDLHPRRLHDAVWPARSPADDRRQHRRHPADRVVERWPRGFWTSSAAIRRRS